MRIFSKCSRVAFIFTLITVAVMPTTAGLPIHCAGDRLVWTIRAFPEWGGSQLFIHQREAAGDFPRLELSASGGLAICHIADLPTGELVLAGRFQELLYFGEQRLHSSGGWDLFILILDEAGEAAALRRFGGSGDDFWLRTSVHGLQTFQLQAGFTGHEAPYLLRILIAETGEFLGSEIFATLSQSVAQKSSRACSLAQWRRLLGLSGDELPVTPWEWPHPSEIYVVDRSDEDEVDPPEQWVTGNRGKPVPVVDRSDEDEVDPPEQFSQSTMQIMRQSP